MESIMNLKYLLIASAPVILATVASQSHQQSQEWWTVDPATEKSCMQALRSPTEMNEQIPLSTIG